MYGTDAGDTGMELHDLLGDPEFISRTGRKRDYQQPFEALRRLTRMFAERPQDVLQELVNAAVNCCGADSAGISLAEPNESGESTFRWIAVSGSFEFHLGRRTPRFFSPCGTCLDRGRPQLYRVTKPYYDFLGITAEPITDGMLIPWEVDGIRGTIWAVSHSSRQAFGLQDYEMLCSLADFVGVILRQQAADERNRRAEQDLRDNSKHLGELAAIVTSSDDVIVSKNLDGIITSWNDAATRVFGYSADEMIGASILKLIPEHLQSEEKVIMENIRAGRRVEHFETIRQTKTGELIEVSLTISPVKDAKGEIVGASKILRDISARKRMEESLLKAQKIAATGRMAATIAHEVNNPLEAVLNLLFLLRTKVIDEDGAKFLAAAETEIILISHITKQTLGFYRENTPASLASIEMIIEHTLLIYEPRCEAAGISIERSYSPSRKVILRQGEMTQVISNLIVNAIQAMPRGGTLSISVRDIEGLRDGVEFTVKDNGVGIPKCDLPKVFDAFFTTRAAIGVGIGLFVAKQYVEGHGGTIEIESHAEPEMSGTSVCVFLPVHTEHETPK